MSLSKIEQEAITRVKAAKTEWETGTAFITERVAFEMRNLIRNLRKNYWGVYDKPTDPVTKRKKIWIPLTESMVESVVKNIDLDTKDINFRAKRPNSRGATQVIRSIVKNNLDEIFFGEHLDELARVLARDGTAVWKTMEDKDENGNPRIKIQNVDLLNFYIDPTAKNIQESEAVIERAVMTKKEVRGMSGWQRTDEVEGRQNIHRTDDDMMGTQATNVERVEVYEYWGLAPKFLLTGKEEDQDTMEEMHIVISDLDQSPIVHLVEKNRKKLRPYEEAWYSRVPGRWYGKGVAEKLMMMQLWLNTVVNIRINRSYVSQLGLFKVRRGSGITPQMVGKLAANGAIMVRDQSDIEQFVMQEASSASYQDEQNIQSWSQRVTSAFEVVTGEALPASTTATAVATQTQTAQSQFVLIKEGVGIFLQRWLKRHALPIITKGITHGDIVRHTGDPKYIAKFDKSVVLHMASKQIKDIEEAGDMVDPVQVQEEIDRAIAQLQEMGSDRYVEMMEDIDFSEFDTQVYITNEEIDKGVLTQNLLGILQVLPNIPNSNVDPADIVKTIFDTMGLDPLEIDTSQQAPTPEQLANQGQQQGTPQSAPNAQIAELTAQANTLKPAQR